MQLACEALEDRTTPATLTLLSTVTVGDWFDPGIWDLNQVPQAGDTVNLASTQNAVISYDSTNRPSQYSGSQYIEVANLLMTETLTVIGTLTVTGMTELYDPTNPQFGAGTLNVALAPNPGMIVNNNFKLEDGVSNVDAGGFLIIQGTGTWTGGTMTGAGTTIVSAGATLSVNAGDPPAIKILDGHELVNEGTIVVSGSLNVQNGSDITNRPGATFEVGHNGTGGVYHVAGDVTAFTNEGTLKATGGAYVAQMEVNVTNKNLIDLNDGDLDVSGQLNQSEQGAKIQVPQNGVLYAWKPTISAGTIEGVAAGVGWLWVYGSPAAAGTLDFSGGKIETNLLVDNNVTWNWTGGDLMHFDPNVTRLVTVNSGAEANWGPAVGTKLKLRTAEFRNYGTISWLFGELWGAEVAFENFGVLSIGDVTLTDGGASSTLTNTGTLVKAVGAQEAVLTWRYTDIDALGARGLTNVVSGKLSFAQGQYHGTFLLPQGTELVFTTPVQVFQENVLAPSLQIVGAGKVRATADTKVQIAAAAEERRIEHFVLEEFAHLIVVGDFSAKKFEWNGGTLSGVGTTRVGANDEMIIETIRDVRISQTTIQNFGTITWKGGVNDITIIDAVAWATSIVNDGSLGKGIFDIQVDKSIRHFEPTVKNSKIIVQNGAVLQKSAGDGETVIQPPIEVDNNANSKIDAKGRDLKFQKINKQGGKLELNGGNVTVVEAFEHSGGETWIQGGTLTLNGVVVFASGTWDLGYGTVHVSGGLEIGVNAVLTGSGTVVGNVANAGLIEVGGEGTAGIITIIGNFANSTTSGEGTINIEIGGYTPGVGYDRLQIEGDADLSGTLNLTLIDNFVPDPDDDFDPITFWDHVGAFDLVNGLDLGGGLSFQSSYLTDRFRLHTVQNP